MYIMKCEWLKNESNYFVTLVLSVDPATSSDCYKCELISRYL